VCQDANHKAGKTGLPMTLNRGLRYSYHAGDMIPGSF